MSNKYLNFITDKHLISCIQQLHKSYIKAKNNISKKSLYSNKVDIFKLTFDLKFNELEEKELIQAEILRQIDKSINNSIGTFHEQILGGIKGYELGKLSGFDIKAKDNSLFADIKNKHNTMNSSSSEALFQKLSRYANDYKQAKCYWVQILAKSSFNEPWKGEINGKEYSHTRVFKISGDKFYSLLTGDDQAFYKLYKVLPLAIKDYLKSIESSKSLNENSAIKEITSDSKNFKRSIIDQISFENFCYYSGFETL